jgi:hypothetical protein
MTDSQPNEARGPGFWIVQAILIVVLVVLAYYAGRFARDSIAHGGGTDDATAVAGAKKLLSDAAGLRKGEWTPADELAFRSQLANVSYATRRALRRQWVGDVNAGKLKRVYPEVQLRACTADEKEKLEQEKAKEKLCMVVAGEKPEPGKPEQAPPETGKQPGATRPGTEGKPVQAK